MAACIDASAVKRRPRFEQLMADAYCRHIDS
jgi:hypothetical protein